MAYGKFNTYEEAATTFNIQLIELSFVQENPLQIGPEMFSFVEDNLRTRRSYVSENAICENLISPILTIVAKHHHLPVWSHLRLDVSEEEGLVGIPDFIIAPASNIGTTLEMEIFGIVTTGNIWQFGKLANNRLTLEVVAYSAVENLQQLLNILNWMFQTAKNNLEKYVGSPKQPLECNKNYCT